MNEELREHFENIDAAVFSGDEFLNQQANNEAQVYVDRWNRELERHRKLIKELRSEA